MVSIGIKSKFNTKTNTKQLLVALNFNNLSLHHTFCSQVDYWIFQLILLFDLIDIDIIGYEAPIVLTELHLNVSNSCILYKPIYLTTRSLIAFKSLHWSSNVTAESSLTLLVFNIEASDFIRIPVLFILNNSPVFKFHNFNVWSCEPLTSIRLPLDNKSIE